MENETIVQEHTNNNKRRVKLIVSLAAAIVVVLLVVFYFMNKKTLPANAGIPEESTFYMANKNDAQVLFYRFADLIIDEKQPPRTRGHIAFLDRVYDNRGDPNIYADFKELQNQRKVFTFNGHAAIENYVTSGDKNYFVLSYVGGKEDKINYLYQINLKTLASTKIMEHELRTGKPPYNGGIAYITDFMPDRYVTYTVIKANPPPAELPAGVVIRNIQTGQEKVLGVVGDTQVDLAKNVVSYKKLGKVRVPCGKPDPVCFATDTYKMVYKPTGEVMTQALP